MAPLRLTVNWRRVVTKRNSRTRPWRRRTAFATITRPPWRTPYPTPLTKTNIRRRRTSWLDRRRTWDMEITTACRLTLLSGTLRTILTMTLMIYTRDRRIVLTKTSLDHRPLSRYWTLKLTRVLNLPTKSSNVDIVYRHGVPLTRTKALLQVAPFVT